MATIKITDALQGEILSANPQVNMGFGKYLKNFPGALLAGSDLGSQFTKDLAVVNPGESGFGLKFSQAITLGNGKPQLNVSAGAKASIGVYNRTGVFLFDQTFLGAPPKVAGGQAFVAFAFHPSLSVAVNGASGELGFGFQAGTEAEIRCYRPFDTLAAPTKLADACKLLLENYVIPGTAADLESMRDLPEASIAAASGKGSLSISATVDFATAFNPLASLNTIPRVGKVTIGGGASIKAGVSAKIFGEFQIRVQKLAGNQVRLSYHKMHGGELGFSVTGGAGPNVSVGDRELLAMMFGGDPSLSGDTETKLVAAGITKKQLDDLRAAMRAGMSRKLNIEFAAQFSSLKKHDAAFEYEIDLDALDPAGRRALDEALAGNLSELNAMEDQPSAHGIRVNRSLTKDLRKRALRWRINLLGLVNAISLTEFIRTGAVFHDNESGEVVITDEASIKRMGAITQRSNIRKVLYESALLTATYKAAGVDVNQDLKASQSFFLFDQSANRQRVADFLDAVSGAGLMDADDIDTTLDGIDDFGSASLLLEMAFDQAACENMFLENGKPRSSEFYEDAGKLAQLALIAERDPDNYRRIPLLNANLWKQMTEAGQPNFSVVLPPPITGGASAAVRVAVVVNDYSLIRWWSATMAEAAEKLADMRKFLNGRDATRLDHDQDFERRRKELADSLAESIQKNTANFDDPWGLLALFYASRRTAEISALLVSQKLTLSLPV